MPRPRVEIGYLRRFYDRQHLPGFHMPADIDAPLVQVPAGTRVDGSTTASFTAPGFGWMDDLFSIAYEELRRIAASIPHSGPNVNVSTQTLIHEAWLKLVNSSKLSLNSKLHFTCVAAKVMCQIVVDIARRRGAAQRAALFVTFDEALGVSVSRNRDVLALDAALEELARMNPRQARTVELRFFGGLDIPEIVAALGVSKSTVDRDWRVAKAWLQGEIRREH